MRGQGQTIMELGVIDHICILLILVRYKKKYRVKNHWGGFGFRMRITE